MSGRQRKLRGEQKTAGASERDETDEACTTDQASEMESPELCEKAKLESEQLEDAPAGSSRPGQLDRTAGGRETGDS